MRVQMMQCERKVDEPAHRETFLQKTVATAGTALQKSMQIATRVEAENKANITVSKFERIVATHDAWVMKPLREPHFKVGAVYAFAI
mmetsp:Transcript_12574/g.39121  ORF Transcript_12574/g.39121 Transcript_12574/m.39121 type:complete len:87 (-) Transcript_12574:145-405(-)